ncbi:glutathione S-transferase family protein [Shimia biformata]|uniref:glutathione S-transferase family protein n=1 Tax=Shimia biformata TaxID=1294299 RepID=UPI001951C074|nr:Tom37 metaxin N-terminal-like domain-containing protein [Shimia biformata]
MLTLLTFPGSDHLPTHSPFGLKAMCLLTMSGLPWQVEYTGDLDAMPLRRLPVLRTDHGLIPDSHHIQEHLESLGADFHPGLDAADRALSHALVHMVEDSLRLGLVHDRWLHPDVWPTMREAFFAGVPAPARAAVSEKAQAQVRAGLMGQGIAQFAEKDRLRRLAKDVHALETVLGDGPFLFGDVPTAADAVAGPVVDMIRDLPTLTGLRQLITDRTGLIAYADAVRRAIYPQKVIISDAA